MKKVATIISSVVAAFFVAVVLLLCLERVPVGYVGVVYSARGVEQNTLSQGWHFLSPMKHVSKFPISQQQLIFRMTRQITTQKNTQIGILTLLQAVEWLE